MDDTTISINGIWFVAAIAALVTVLLVAVIWQVGGAVRARAAAAREDAYRDLATRTTATAARTNEDLDRIAADVADMKSRLTAMERLMREVE
jgi:hypothetical protein